MYESWCKHINNETKRAYDLKNHIIVPKKRRSENNSSSIKGFHGRFSVISALRSPIKLKIFNCSHRHSMNSIVHQGSAIEVNIPEFFFIMFHCGLVHCGTPSWYISNGEYFSNTILFFSIVEKDYNDEHVYTHQMDSFLCKLDQCEVCKETQFSTIEKHGPLINLRTLKRSNAKINENQKDSKFHIINGKLYLLGWVVSKAKNVIADNYDIALTKMIIIKQGNYWQKLVNTDDKKSILFPGNYHGSRFECNDFPFFILKGKHFDDYNVSMQNLVDSYSFSKIDYKLFHPNLIQNDEHIELLRKNHCDFTINVPIELTSKKRKSKKITNK